MDWYAKQSYFSTDSCHLLTCYRQPQQSDSGFSNTSFCSMMRRSNLFFYLFKKKFLILILNSNFGNRSLKLRSDNEKSLTKSCRRFLFENNLHGHVTCLIERNLRASLPAQCLLCLRRVTRADLLNSIKRPSKPVEPDLGSPVIFQLFRICIRDYKVQMKLFPRLKFSRYTNFVQ